MEGAGYDQVVPVSLRPGWTGRVDEAERVGCHQPDSLVSQPSTLTFRGNFARADAEMLPNPVDEHGEKQKSADQRRDDGLRHLLKMKPKRHEDMKLGKPRNRKQILKKKPGR